MVRSFQHPALLIEFDPKRGFQWGDEIPNEIHTNSIRSKLVLLSLHFPKLAYFWSQSPHSTSDLFLEIKVKTKEEK